MSPMTMATTPPARTATSTGQPWLVANSAVVKAPIPAKVIWQSHSMPPSPVTSVQERKITAKAKAWAMTPTQ